MRHFYDNGGGRCYIVSIGGSGTGTAANIAADHLAGLGPLAREDEPTLLGFSDVRGELDLFSVILPPAAAVAGVYATVDRTRGVWKSPANESLASVRSLAVAIDNDLNDNMNVDTTGKSINALRAFSGKGFLVWGARTLAGNDNEWRYVSVRRFFNMVEESCRKATEPFVFDPNDAGTWVKVKAMIENFLVVHQRAFGGDFVPATYQVVLDTAAGNAVGAVTPRNAAAAERRYRLFNSVRHYYANGGGPCYIVSVGSYTDAPALGNTTSGLQ